jgi:hypothetical protein
MRLEPTFQKTRHAAISKGTMLQLRGTVKQVYLFFPGTLGFSKQIAIVCTEINEEIRAYLKTLIQKVGLMIWSVLELLLKLHRILEKSPTRTKSSDEISFRSEIQNEYELSLSIRASVDSI